MDYHISQTEFIIFGVVTLWDLAWRGIALWRSSQRHQGVWFVFLLLINSAGLLPIVYLMLHRNVTEQKRGKESP